MQKRPQEWERREQFPIQHQPRKQKPKQKTTLITIQYNNKKNTQQQNKKTPKRPKQTNNITNTNSKIKPTI